MTIRRLFVSADVSPYSVQTDCNKDIADSKPKLLDDTAVHCEKPTQYGSCSSMVIVRSSIGSDSLLLRSAECSTHYRLRHSNTQILILTGAQKVTNIRLSLQNENTITEVFTMLLWMTLWSDNVTIRFITSLYRLLDDRRF